MRIWFKRSIVVIWIALLAAQFYQPSKVNPPTDPQQEIGASITVSPRVAAILERSCNDCHSNRTVWPWYSKIAPASWLVANDVNEGRNELNFSEWATYNPEKSTKLLDKLCKETSRGKMPQAPYSLLHPNAKLTAADIQTICEWSTSVRASLPAVAEANSETEEEYEGVEHESGRRK